ncbi:maleylpyruvate isomerase family mycothiol-dependent enzyme [Streptomyces griseorubiginosus]|uniref:maleylpyruvate isomerase family mycothiol-dependent enzyme n=1 Tax=Streptomyces griseorubiginosus TaxID=67304 RepID=UPI0033CE3499
MTTNRQPEPFFSPAYRSCRDNIIRLARAHPERASCPVPACPGWNVRDVISHLLQICQMIVAGVPVAINHPPAPEPETPLTQLLSDWEELDESLAKVLEHTPWLRRGTMLLDVFSHELDLRSALGITPPRDHPAFADALELATMGFTMSVNAHQLPVLRLMTPGHTWLIGEGAPDATVRGDSLEVFRCLTGRRTLTQIRQLLWSTEPDTWLPAFTWGPFTPPREQIESSVTAVDQWLWFLPPYFSLGVAP